MLVKVLGFYIFQFLPIVAIEFVILWRMNWGKVSLCAFDSLMMNFTSFIGLLLGLGPYITTSGPWGLTLFGTYSIMVEGAVLMLLERHPTKQVWLTVAVANLGSCLMLGLETFFKIPIMGK